MGAQSSRTSNKSNVATFKSYQKLDDDSIVSLSQNGDKEAQSFLMSKYEFLVHFKAKSYFLQGADRDDTLQEGMIGLYKAIRDYKPDQFCSFRSFALLCITRQIITALKTATRKKHLPLNCYASLNSSLLDDDDNSSLIDVMEDEQTEDPLESYIVEEQIDEVKDQMKKLLSELEWEVLTSYIDGKSYQEIGKELNTHTKVVDNALCRIKSKLKDLEYAS